VWDDRRLVSWGNARKLSLFPVTTRVDFRLRALTYYFRADAWISSPEKASFPGAWVFRMKKSQKQVMVRRVATLALTSLLGLCVASGAMAETPAPPHVTQINPRVLGQQHRVVVAAPRLQITPPPVRRDPAVEARLRWERNRYEALHDDHVTPVEQFRINQEPDRISIGIHDQNH
jgi:hypothetical protein